MVLLIVLILIIIIAIASTFLFVSDGDSKIEQALGIDRNPEENHGKETNPNNNQEVTEESTNTPGISGGGGDSGGGSGGGSNEGTSSSNCEIKQISYGLINPWKNVTCNQYQDEICIEKTITCARTVQNRDLELGGIFEIELFFIEYGIYENILEQAFDSVKKSFNIAPLNSTKMEGTTTIQSTGINGTANKDINCFFNMLQVPYKEIC